MNDKENDFSQLNITGKPSENGRKETSPFQELRLLLLLLLVYCDPVADEIFLGYALYKFTFYLLTYFDGAAIEDIGNMETGEVGVFPISLIIRSGKRRKIP